MVNEKTLYSIIVPIKNEEENISNVIDELDSVFSNAELLVVVGQCTDNTKEVLNLIDNTRLKNRLCAVNQINTGKASAVWTGVELAVGKTIVVFDGDRTISAIDAMRVAQTASDNKVLAIAERLTLRDRQAMPFINFLYNKFMVCLFALIFGRRCSDLFAGCKAFPGEQKWDFLNSRFLFSSRDNWSDLQMLSAACELHLGIESVSVRYREREHGKSKIHRIRDGIDLAMFLVDAAWVRTKSKAIRATRFIGFGE